MLDVAETSESVDGVLAFAPGEYFETKTFIAEAAKGINCPAFITSAKDEVENWKTIYEAIPSKFKHSFLPPTKGNHGSRALWTAFEDSPAYWQAVNDFLKTYFIQN